MARGQKYRKARAERHFAKQRDLRHSRFEGWEDPSVPVEDRPPRGNKDLKCCDRGPPFCAGCPELLL